jgi:hypothetical protein
LSPAISKIYSLFSRRSLILKSMSAKAKTKKEQHQILVPMDKLTSNNLGPTPQEMFQLMHLTYPLTSGECLRSRPIDLGKR